MILQMHDDCFYRVGLMVANILLLLLLVGCGGSPISHGTPTPSPRPSPTACRTPSPIPTSIPSPTLTTTPTQEEPTPTPTPCPPLPSACTPAPSVQPVSAAPINHGDTNKHQVALTIDSFGTEELTLRFLDILSKHHVHATWFPEGSEALQGPYRIQRVHNAGDEIGNHTMHHPHLTALSDEQVCNEINEAEQALHSITGHTTRPYFRPPYGDVDERVRQVAAHLGYRTVLWSIDTEDYQPDATSDKIIQRVMSKLSNGSIILMHTTEVEAQTLDKLMTLIEQQGFQMVTMTEVLQ